MIAWLIPDPSVPTTIQKHSLAPEVPENDLKNADRLFTFSKLAAFEDMPVEFVKEVRGKIPEKLITKKGRWRKYRA